MTSLTHSKIICHFRSIFLWFPVYTFPSAEVEHGSWTMNPIDYRMINILINVFKKIFQFQIFWATVYRWQTETNNFMRLVTDLSPTYLFSNSLSSSIKSIFENEPVESMQQKIIQVRPIRLSMFINSSSNF